MQFEEKSLLSQGFGFRKNDGEVRVLGLQTSCIFQEFQVEPIET